MEGGTEALLCSVKIADEVSFKELDSVELQDRELVECIVSTGSFDSEELGLGEMFVVGTSILEEDDSMGGEEVMRGRILAYEVNKEKKLKLVTQIKVKGACRSLAMCEGKIVAGLVKTVSSASGNQCLCTDNVIPGSTLWTSPVVNKGRALSGVVQAGNVPHLDKPSVTGSHASYAGHTCTDCRCGSDEVTVDSAGYSARFDKSGV